VGHPRFLRILGLTLVSYTSSSLLDVPAALADEPSAADRATARTLAQEGYVALRDKDYATAADRFGRAEALVHAPTLLRDLARAQVGLGKLVDAHENYSLIIREGVAPDAPQPWVQALADAKAEIVAIPPRLPWVTITVTGPSDPVVTIDGVTISSASLGVKRPADPGKHEIRAAAKGYYTAKKSVVLNEGESVNIAFELEDAPPDAPPEPEETGPVQRTDAPVEPAWRKPAIISAFALGGAGLALGGVTGVLAIRKHSQLSTSCREGTCFPPQKGELDSYHRLGTLSTIGFIAGGVGVASGVVLLLVKPQSTDASATGKSTAKARSALRMAPFVGLASAGVEGTF
jgi:hypothetical protein